MVLYFYFKFKYDEANYSVMVGILFLTNVYDTSMQD